MYGSDDLEVKLHAPQSELPPYPAKYISLASGEKMVVRQVKMEENPLLLEVIEPLIKVDEDFLRYCGSPFL